MFQSLFEVARAIVGTRQRYRDKRVEAERLIGAELENLADLLAKVLAAADKNGRLANCTLMELDELRRRTWVRWIQILDSAAYDRLTDQDREEIESIIRIAHAAPGSYVEEVYVVQCAISNGVVPAEVRDRFRVSIEAIRNKAAELRLRT